MPRLRSVRTGAVISCSEDTATRLDSEWQPFDGTTPPEPEAPEGEPAYGEWTAKELKAEIAARNENRADDDQLPATGNKAALVAVLEQDDAQRIADDEEDSEDNGEEPESDGS